MEYSFHIQDPTDPDTLYLYEALVGQIRKDTLTSWKGLFAFATGNAVQNFFVEDPDVNRFVQSGEIELVVGVDAVTNVSALEQLAQLNDQYDGFNAKVFFSRGVRLFHPKIAHFSHEGNYSTLIVGSGNLTPGGLKNNTEAFAVIAADESELKALSALDDFLTRHASEVKDIDEEALALARENQSSFTSRRRKARESEPEEPGELEDTIDMDDEPDPPSDSKVLVARIPKAGGRWRQVHYNETVVSEFFQVSPGTAQRVYLRHVHPDGTAESIEARPLVYSEGNRNMKIEVAAARGEDYPEEGRPMIVLRETGARSFDYVLLMPGDDGHTDMMDFTEQRESVGRTFRDVRRAIATYGEIKEKWPGCPL